MAISIIELPALFALLAASPPAPPVRHGCQTAAPSDFDCCIHLAASGRQGNATPAPFLLRPNSLIR